MDAETPPASPRVKPRIAVLAYACEPGIGSEQEVGWRWATAVPDSFEAVVFTRAKNWGRLQGETAVHEGLPAKRLQGRSFVCVPVPGLDRRATNSRLVRTHFVLWQWMAYRHLRRHRASYDLVHQVNYAAMWMPAFCAFSGVPFVWGPMGTNLRFPRWYRPAPRWLGGPRIRTRRLLTETLPRWNPAMWACERRTARFLLVHVGLSGMLPPGVRGRALVQPAIGTAETWLTPPAAGTGPREPLLLFVGRYHPSKMPELALAAMRRAVEAQPGARAVLVGPGLRRALGDPGHPRIEVRDEVPSGEVRRLLDAARVFVFPSVEGSGFVVLEALARGLPVVCLQGTGPALSAGDAGEACSPGPSLDATAVTLAAACLRLLRDDAAWSERSRRAVQRAEEYRWERLRPFLQMLYGELLETSTPGTPAAEAAMDRAHA